MLIGDYLGLSNSNYVSCKNIEKYPTSIDIDLSLIRMLVADDLPKIEKVIFNPPATIVFWDDGTKTIVKDTDGHWKNVQKANKSKRDKKIAAWKEAGILNAIAKKFYKNYQDVLETWIDEC